MKLKDLRCELLKQLKNSELDTPEADISVILKHILKIDKTQLVLGEREITDSEYAIIKRSVERLESGEPVQYIVGHCEFMSLDFIVKPGVLIPRADTEVLVETVLSEIPSSSVGADFCCGSGCIGISLAYYTPDIFINCIDVSATALSIAKENAEKNGVADKIEFLNMDLLNEMPSRTFDFIVSNPPYIRTDVIPTLNHSVRESEPRLALDGGDDGLVFYRRISKKAPLKYGGLLAFEIGYDQGTEVSDILIENGYKDIRVIKDIEGRDRVVTAIKFPEE